MSYALNVAITTRIRSEDLSAYADAEAAQAVVNQYPVRYGTTASAPSFPCVTFYEDTGTESLQGVDIGIVQNSIYRFQVWMKDRAGDVSAIISQTAEALEQLFDQRRGAPNLTLDGDGRVYWSELFVPLQAPLHVDSINAYFGMIAFRFVEARP